MKKFRFIDNALGWAAFLIAAVVYCLTIEPTASFWDCPEFTSTGYKLEVGHPPGAPFFMLTANLFTQFASDASMVARMVNTMSALLSATTIMFLFWTITHLVRKLILKDWSELTTAKLIAIEASGLVGALIYTFSDTFWFSAVESEVYAYSSAFTAVVFWLILKWEDHADEPHSDRWLVLIFYMIGLSIGVHLLNLLCIPAIVLVYVYKRFPNIEVKGSLLALLVSAVLIAGVLYGVVPGIITVGGWFELLFVNVLHCPFNTGEIIYILLLVATVIWALWETYQEDNEKRENLAFVLAVAMLGIPFYGYGWKAVCIGVIVLALLWFALNYKRIVDKKKIVIVTSRMKNTMLLCMLMLMIGYSSYALIVIRSSANPPMDQNSPEDIFTLGSYLSRDQYGDRPLFYGPAYTSQVAFDVEGNMCIPKRIDKAPIYSRVEKKSPDEPDRYFVVSHKAEYKYAQNMLFPRMHSSRPEHVSAYEDWMGGVKGYEIPYDRCGEDVMVKMPTQWENLKFFLSYQCNWMYWRYFMWNFVGRQNDLQGHGTVDKGNWLTGFNWFDNHVLGLGDQQMLPDELKNNKGHNVFYGLPLILGLIGLFWQAYRGRRGIRQFWVVFFLFFMTGLAIVLYLNQSPLEPRERDYAYAGSFYAFAIWCGIGVAALIDWVKKHIKVHETIIATIIGLACLAIPVQMACQTWDDHDRSGRYTCRDYGQNYLMTLPDEGNPIIFTNGDNDTFPLWYNQDVEGVRTDARVCNLSYLQTDWYIDQMIRPAYDSPALPITWPRIDYCIGTNEAISIDPSVKPIVEKFCRENPQVGAERFGEEPFDVKNIMKYWVRNEDEGMRIIPTDTLYVTIDKEAVRQSGMLMASDSIPDRMVISLKGKRTIYKHEMMMLEMIANANWTRPIYVANSVGPDNYLNLGENFVQEGLASRITPFSTYYTNDKGDLIPVKGVKNFDTEKVYDNVMNRFKWGGMEKPGLYIDETVAKMCISHRRLMAQLALSLAQDGDTVRAKKVLEKCAEVLPTYNFPMDYISGGADLMRANILIGDTERADAIATTIWNRAQQFINYYLSLDYNQFTGVLLSCQREFFYAQNILDLERRVNPEKGEKLLDELDALYGQYIQKGGAPLY